MAEKIVSVPLEGALKGRRYTVSAVQSSGCSTAVIKVRDDRNTYAQLSYDFFNSLMGQKSFTYFGSGPLCVDLDVTLGGKPADVKYLKGVTELKDAKGNWKCTAWTIAVEDSYDNDYNEFIVSVVATL